MKPHSFRFSAIALALLVPLLGCSGAEKTPINSTISATVDPPLNQRLVTIATGGASGPYNIIATALAEQYNQILGVNARTQTTGASIENMNLLAQGKVEMAFVQSDVLRDALEGGVNFTSPVNNVRQMAALYPNYVHVVSRPNANIKSLADLRGKRVAVGDQNSGTEFNARVLLAAAGLSYQDIKVDYLGFAAASDALRAGQVDAAFFTSGLPNAAILGLTQTQPMTLVPISAELLSNLATSQDYFISINIPANTYGNQTEITTAAIKNALVVRADLSDEDVYQLTKTFFDQLQTLETAHQAAAQINFAEAQEGLAAPLHPGAERLYEERRAH